MDLMDAVEWEAVNRFADICRDVGAFGYGDGWEAQVEEFLAEVASLETLMDLMAECSSNGHSSRLDTLCVILGQILSSNIVKDQMVDEKFLPRLQGGLGHSLAKVRLLASRQILKVGLDSFPNNLQLIQGAIESLADKNIGVCANSTEALLEHAQKSDINSKLILENVAESLMKATELVDNQVRDSIVTVRALSLAIRICSRNNASFGFAREFGILDKVFDLLAGDDVLLQMNILKLIPLIASTDNGLEAIASTEIVDRLLKLTRNCGSESAHGFSSDSAWLEIEALEVLSLVAARLLSGRDVAKGRRVGELFLDTVSRGLNVAQDTSRMLFVSLIGSFSGAQPPASLKMVLIEKRTKVFDPWILAATKYSTDTSEIGIQSIAFSLRGGVEANAFKSRMLFRTDSDDGLSTLEESMAQLSPEECSAAAKLGQQVYLAFGQALNARLRVVHPSEDFSIQHVIAVLFKLLDSPFDKVKCSVYVLLRIVAAQSDDWGPRSLLGTTAGTLEKLMDRATEMSKTAKELRFALIETLTLIPKNESVFSSLQLSLLEEFLRRGPYVGPKSARVEVLTKDPPA